jgi:hypothetical protein
LLSKGLLKTKKRPITCLPNNKKKGNECRTFSMQRCRASGSHCIPKGFNDCRKR